MSRLDQLLFWTATGLELKLTVFKEYYNRYRTHAARPPQASRIVARTGLRMMPTFPTTLSIIPYGGFSPVRLEDVHVRWNLPVGYSLKLAPSMRESVLPVCRYPSYR